MFQLVLECWSVEEIDLWDGNADRWVNVRW